MEDVILLQVCEWSEAGALWYSPAILFPISPILLDWTQNKDRRGMCDHYRNQLCAVHLVRPAFSNSD